MAAFGAEIGACCTFVSLVCFVGLLPIGDIRVIRGGPQSLRIVPAFALSYGGQARHLRGRSATADLSR